MSDINVLDKKIVIIGGGGFIGHNLALTLNEMGANVDLIDSLQVNNLYSFQYSNDEIVNKDLYVKIINERLSLLRNRGIHFIFKMQEIIMR